MQVGLPGSRRAASIHCLRYVALSAQIETNIVKSSEDKTRFIWSEAAVRYKVNNVWTKSCLKYKCLWRVVLMTENDESLSQSCLVSVTWKYGGTAAFYDQCVWHIIIFSDVTVDTRYNCVRHGTKTRCWWDRSCDTFVQDPEVMRRYRSRENTRAAFYRCVVLYYCRLEITIIT